MASMIEALAGEGGSEAEGTEAGDSVERLIERADMAAWMEAFFHSGA